MKVAFLYANMGKGGAQRVIAGVANYINQQGFPVDILVYDSNKSVYRINKEVNFINMNISRANTCLLEKSTSFIKAVDTIRKTVQKENIDILVTFSAKITFTAITALLGTNVKVIGSERANPNTYKKNMLKKILKEMCVFSDGFIFQTEGVKKCYPKIMRKKSIVIPNGIFATLPSYIPRYSERKPMTACATGRLTNQKNYKLMINAVENIVDEYPDFNLFIFGSGELKNKIQAYINKKELQNNIFLKGYSKDVPTDLTKNRIFILSSDYEGMPNGLIEGMACGCACISTDCEFGPSDLIEQGYNGILVPVDDENALTNAIKKILNDKQFAEKISKNAIKIKKKLDGKIIMDRYLTYIENVYKN